MKVSALSVGDVLEDTKRCLRLEITGVSVFSGGGNGDLMFDEVSETHRRHRCVTFKQFERLKFVRRMKV